MPYRNLYPQLPTLGELVEELDIRGRTKLSKVLVDSTYEPLDQASQVIWSDGEKVGVIYVSRR